ncbi:hypothetical protein DWU98_03340 [Dyella monticola]|uniref:Uncharacterized protein n=1 Tax=Dyella monticola TaxID=1927958 RepID=A0A370X9P8_9GAMM|nr:hypothetical protein [Dyella monticola]RDS84987.1 hypothetical protein DWU98_03340 [Dyella monticola]
MNNRIPTLASLLGAGLLFAGVALAQTQNQPMQQQPAPQTQNTSPSQNMASPQQGTMQQGSTGASPSQGSDSATYNTSRGQVTVNSTMGSAPSTASPPSFEQLAGGKKYITKDDANAYPPLANDFLYVAHNGNRISKTQYEHWVQNLN